jgi:uncharacterized lipoprotein YehR (DUF1307 family)
MRRWLMLVLSAIFVASITGCGEEETAKKETTKTEQTEEKSKPAATQPKEKKEASAVNTEATEQLKEYLDTNFSMTTWYPHIKGVEIEIKEKKATVHIDVNDKEVAKKIATGIWGWTNSNDNEFKLDEIEFLNQDGQTVSVEKNPLK